MFACYIWFFTSHQQSYSNVRTGLPGLNQHYLGLMCLAQRHNAVTPVRLEPAAFGLESSTLPLSIALPHMGMQDK